MDSIPESGRSPGEGSGNPLQYSCLGNLMDRAAWRATVHGVTKESDTTERLNTGTWHALRAIHVPLPPHPRSQNTGQWGWGIKCSTLHPFIQQIFNKHLLCAGPGLLRWCWCKEPTCQCRRHRDSGSIPGSRKSPWGGYNNPLQYSCLVNPMDRAAWPATVHGVTKSWTIWRDLACIRPCAGPWRIIGEHGA